MKGRQDLGVRRQDVWRLPDLATTLSTERGAGFYAALYGPLPFTFGPVPAERYTVTRVTRPLAFHP